jgi:hypothetical protein
MGRGNSVARCQGGGKANRSGFLTDGRVDPSGYLSSHSELFRSFFEATDEEHGTEPADRFLADGGIQSRTRRAYFRAGAHAKALAVSSARCSMNAARSLAESTPS